MAHPKTFFVALSLASLLAPSLALGASVQDVLGAAERTDADRKRDVTSKPAAVLNLLGLREGMVVLDLFAGGGYYSEIVAGAVGEKGKVYMHNNQAYMQFAGEDLVKRNLDGRMANVVSVQQEIGDIDLEDGSVDMVLMVMAYHDVYYKTDGWNLDKEELFSMIQRVLREDGILGVVDHAAAKGSGSSAAQELHRIDPAFARADIESMGFEFAGQTSALKAQDDPTVSVFDPSIQGRTNRFIYKFVVSQ